MGNLNPGTENIKTVVTSNKSTEKKCQNYFGDLLDTQYVLGLKLVHGIGLM
jgi:hypothetical protein